MLVLGTQTPGPPQRFRDVLEQGAWGYWLQVALPCRHRAKPREQVCRLTPAPRGPEQSRALGHCELLALDLTPSQALLNPCGEFKAPSSEQVTVHSDLFQERRRSVQAEPQTPALPPQTASQ